MWAGDAADMAASGIEWVRIGEFAWSRLEPSPGVFQFDWLDRAIDTLSRNGLKVVLGTPSCTPPRWMLDRFPDMLALDAEGRPRRFGSRRHYCFTHEGYRAAAADMAGRLGARYGRDPRIHAWQIDNEYGCHDTILSYSDAARVAFQDWLSERYGTVEALNAAWGNVFWSMEYEGFDQIDLPNLTVTEANPSHLLDFRRFSSDQVVRFHEAQVAALRAHTQTPLIHNYMGRVLDFDHFAVGASIEIASWDSYPIGFLSDRIDAAPAHKARYVAQGDPDMQAFHHDLYRAVGRDGRWWVMEQQPGPVNWAPHNVAPLPGMVRLWTWEAYAHGAEVVSYFRWRQAPFAQEQMHAGLKRPDNAPAPALAEVRQVARELRDMPEVAQHPAEVAIVFDYASHWAWQSLPQGADFDYFQLVFELYKALRRQGLSIDFVPSTATDLSAYRLVFAPGIATLPEVLTQALQGVQALVGPRSNAITPDFTIPMPMGPNLPGLDTTVTRVESLPPGLQRPVRGGGAVIRWQETLEGTAPVQISGEDGQPLLVGERLQYLAVWPDADLWRRILTEAADRAGITLTPLPEGLRIRDAANVRFYFNYNPEEIEYKSVFLPPAGVSWTPLP
jgi:beta-galactosidase